MPRLRRNEPLCMAKPSKPDVTAPLISERVTAIFVNPDEELSLLIEEIRSSKGQQVMDEVARLQASVRLVGRNKVELIRALEVLRQDELWNQIILPQHL